MGFHAQPSLGHDCLARRSVAHQDRTSLVASPRSSRRFARDHQVVCEGQRDAGDLPRSHAAAALVSRSRRSKSVEIYVRAVKREPMKIPTAPGR